MRTIKSYIFYFIVFFFGAIIPIIYSPVFLIRSKKLADHGAKMWSIILIYSLKKICNVDYKVVGLEKIPNEPVIIACKHQSMWDTAIMHLIFKEPAYAYKKELLGIPFYGWFVKMMSGIKVDRNGGMSAVKKLITESKQYLKTGHNIVIFPQGTRVPINKSTDEYPYQPGIAAMYLACQVKVVPVALNSGYFWPKGKLIEKTGTITIEFLDPIDTGLNKKDFMQKLENLTEEKTNQLINNN